MVRLKLVLIFLAFPFFVSAQFFGIGGQYAQDSDGQFFVDFSFPTIHPKNKFNSFIASGLEYTTTGGSEISGLNIKPIRVNTFFSEYFFNNTPYTVLLGVDGGYLFNFSHGQKNGIVISPNLYFDYKFFFVKAGYDFDVLNGNNQYFVRAGLSIGLGTLKIFGNTKIW